MATMPDVLTDEEMQNLESQQVSMPDELTDEQMAQMEAQVPTKPMELPNELTDEEMAQLEATQPSEPNLTPKSPWLISEPVKPEEIAQIAVKHNITDPEDIKALSTQIYLKGGTVEGQTRPLAYAAGLASDILLPGDIPAFIQKKLQDSPELRAAMDDVASLSEAKQSTARTVGTLVGGVLAPGLGAAKVLGTAERIGGKILGGAAVGAGMGGVAGLAESKEGQEGSSAAVGAALGGALGGALGTFGGWVAKKEADKAAQLKNTVLAGLPEQDTIMAKVNRAMEETFVPGSTREFNVLADAPYLKKTFPGGKIPKEIKVERKAFAQYLRGDEGLLPNETVSKVIAAERRMGENAIKEKYKLFRQTELAKEFATDVRVAGLNKIPNRLMYTLSKAIEPAMFMADRVDRLFGTNFTKSINEISEATNRFKDKAFELSSKLQPLSEALLKDAKANKMTSTQYINELYHTLDGNPTSDLFKGKEDVVNAWRTFIEDARLAHNEVAGEEVIKRLENFIPHRVMDIPTAVETIYKRLYHLEDTVPEFKIAVDAATDSNPVQLANVLAKLGKEEADRLQEAIHAVKHITGEKITTVNELVRNLEEVSRNPGKALHIGEMSAKSAKSRSGGTPVIIRETNVIKLMEDYIMNTMKAAYLAKPTSRMKAELMTAVKAGGDKRMLDPIGNLLQDVEYGSRAGTMAQAVRDELVSIQLRANKQALIAEREGKPVKAYFARALSKMPGVMSYLGDQIYPNTLGALTNPTSPIKNLMQPFMMTSAEVGYRYSLPTVLRGVSYALANPKKALAELKSLGLHGEGWDKLMNSALTDPNTGKALAAFKKVNHEAMELNMRMFSWSEVINRFAALTLGKKTANDMVSALRNPGKLTFAENTAMNFVDTMTDSMKRSVLDILEKLPNSDAPEELVKQLEKEVSQHLIQKTIFDYNKANASIIARYLPAPMIVFTKFPTYLAGNITSEIEKKGIGGAAPMLMRNYFAPFALVGMIDSLGDELMGEDDNVINKIFGKQGLKGVSNLGGLAGFRAFANPTISAPFKVAGKTGEAAVDLLAGDREAASKAIESVPKEIVNSLSLYAPTFPTSPIKAMAKLIEKMDD